MALESFVQISTALPAPLLPFQSSSVVEYGSIAVADEMCLFEADFEGQGSLGGFPACAPGHMAQGACAPTMHPNLVSTLRSVITRPCGPNGGELVQEAEAGACHAIARKGQHRTARSSKPAEAEPEDRQIANVTVDLIQNRRPFKCAYAGCNKTFKNRQTLKMHHKTHYSDDTASRLESQFLNDGGSCRAGQNKKIPCRCPVCGRTFVGLYELRRHFGRKHSEGEKMHGCRKCGKRFYIEVDLRDHEKLCGEPIECKCGMKFAFKCNLVAHRKTHPECQDSSPSAAEEYSSYRHIHAAVMNSSQCREDSCSPSPSPSPSPPLGLMIPPGLKLEGIGGFPCILPPDMLGHSPMML